MALFEVTIQESLLCVKKLKNILKNYKGKFMEISMQFQDENVSSYKLYVFLFHFWQLLTTATIEYSFSKEKLI